MVRERDRGLGNTRSFGEAVSGYGYRPGGRYGERPGARRNTRGLGEAVSVYVGAAQGDACVLELRLR